MGTLDRYKKRQSEARQAAGAASADTTQDTQGSSSGGTLERWQRKQAEQDIRKYNTAYSNYVKDYNSHYGSGYGDEYRPANDEKMYAAGMYLRGNRLLEQGTELDKRLKSYGYDTGSTVNGMKLNVGQIRDSAKDVSYSWANAFKDSDDFLQYKNHSNYTLDDAMDRRAAIDDELGKIDLNSGNSSALRKYDSLNKEREWLETTYGTNAFEDMADYERYKKYSNMSVDDVRDKIASLQKEYDHNKDAGGQAVLKSDIDWLNSHYARQLLETEDLGKLKTDVDNAKSEWDIAKSAPYLLNQDADIYIHKGGINATDEEREQYVKDAAEARAYARAYEASIPDREQAYYSALEKYNNAKYAQITGADDYDEYSGYVPETGDEKYEYINGKSYYNNPVDIRGDHAATTSRKILGIDDPTNPYDSKGYNFMSDDEKGVYNYIYAKEGSESADEYLESLDLGGRNTEYVQTMAAMAADSSPVASSILAVAMAPATAAGFYEDLGNNIAGNDINTDSPLHAAAHWRQAVTGRVSENIDDKVGEFFYNTGMSMGDNLMNMAVTAGIEPLTLGMMASEVATNTVIDAKNRGLSDTQALELGLAYGAAEVITEKASLDALFDKDTTGVKYVLKNIFTEGSEEVGSDVLDSIADVIISGDKSEWKQSVNEYMKDGDSRKKAQVKTLGDWLCQAGVDFLGGAVSGGVMSGTAAGAGAATNAVSNAVFKKADARYKGKLYNEMSEGNRNPALSEVIDLAKNSSDAKVVKMAGMLENGKKLSNAQMGTVINTVSNEAYSRMSEVMTDSLEKQGIDHDTAARVAEYVYDENPVPTEQTGKLIDKYKSEIRTASAEVEETGTYKSMKKIEDAYEAEAAKRNKEHKNSKRDKEYKNSDSGEEAGESSEKTENDMSGGQTVVDEEYAEFIRKADALTGNSAVAVRTKSGQQPEIRSYKSTGKDISYVTSEGDTVRASDVTASDTLKALDTYVADLPVNAANSLLNGYKANVGTATDGGVVAFGTAYSLMYRYGHAGLSYNGALNAVARGVMPDYLYKRAYELGKDARSTEAAEKVRNKKTDTGQAKTGDREIRKIVKTEGYYGSNVTFDSNVDMEQFNSSEKLSAAGTVIGIIASAKNLNVRFYNRSTTVDGMTISDNGAYYRGTVYIDVNAGNYGQKAVMTTMAHEVTHWLKESSPAAYNELKTAIIEAYHNDSTQEFDSLVNSEMERDGSLSVEDASDEVIARACEDMLRDGTTVSMLAEKHTSLFEKLKTAVNDFIDKIKAVLAKAFKGEDASANAAAVELRKSLEGDMSSIQELWNKAMAEAVYMDEVTGTVKNRRRSQKYYDGITPATRSESLSLNMLDDRNVARYRKEIDGTFTGKLPYRDEILLGMPSELLQQYGVSNGPIYMSQSIARKIAYPLGYKIGNDFVGKHTEKTEGDMGGKHNLGMSALKNLLLQVYDPIVITRNTNLHASNNSIILWTNWITDDGKGIMIPLEIGIGGTKNNVKSVFQVSAGYDKQFFEGDMVLYKKNKDINQLISSRRYMPRVGADDIFVSHSIAQSNSNVNSKISNSPKKSVRDGDDMSTRYILATTLMETTANEAERKSMREYKDAIKDLNDKEERLYAVNAEIKRLSFPDASVDMTYEERKARLEMLKNSREKLTRSLDYWDRKLLSLESTATLRNLAQRQKEALMRKNRAERMEALKAADRKSREKQEDIRNFYRESMARRSEGKKKTERRHAIAKLANDFNRMLSNPTQKAYVDSRFVRPVIDLLETIDVNPDMELKLMKLENQINLETDSYKRARLKERYATLYASNQNMSEKIAKVNLMYEAMKKDSTYVVGYDEHIDGMIRELAAELGDTPLYKMTMDQLDHTYEVMSAVMHTVRDATKMIDVETTRRTYEFGHSMELEAKSVRHKSNGYILMHLTPQRAFKQFGGYTKNSAWEQIGKMLNDGQLEMHKFQMECSNEFRELINDRKQLNDLYNVKKLVDVGLRDDAGNTVKISRGMMLSLYMHLQNKANRTHIMYGGLTCADIKAYYKNKGSRQSFIDGTVVKGVGVELSEISTKLDAEDSGLTEYERIELKKRYKELVRQAEATLDNLQKTIESELTEYEKQWIKKAEWYFNKKSRDAINETTMKLYGYKKARVENYFPIHTDSNYVTGPEKTTSQLKFDATLENMGFLKSRIMNAKNPVYLEDMTYLIDRQVKQVSRFYGMAIPLRNFQRCYNVVYKGYAGSVHETVEKKLGKNAANYVDKLINDLSGLSSTTKGAQIMSTIRGNAAKAVLSINLGVTLKQAASYPTAAVELGYKALLKALVRGGKNGWLLSAADRELIAKYTPLLYYRNLGNSTSELGDMASANSFIGSNTKATKVYGYVMNWIQKMDTATVGRLWYASEYWVEDNTNLKRGTEEFYEAVAEKFNRVVELTQPNYTTMQRPDVLRNGNELLKTFSMFKTQLFQNFNIMYDSAREYIAYRSDFKKGLNGVTAEDVKAKRTTLCNAVTSQVVANVVIAAVNVLWAAIRHRMDDYVDEDGNITAESIAKEMGKDTLESFSGYLMFGAEIGAALSAALSDSTYYGVSMTGIDAIQDAVDDTVSAVKYIRDGRTDKFKDAFIKLGNNIATCFGIPSANVYKLGTAVISWVDDISSGNINPVSKTPSKKTRIKSVLNAYSEGNDEKAEELMDDIIMDYTMDIQSDYPAYTDAKVESTAKSRVKSVITQLYKEDYISGTEQEREQIVDIMYETGLYESRAAVKEICRDWVVSSLKAKYLGTASESKRAEIRKELYATGKWKNLSELDKDIKKWTNTDD